MAYINTITNQYPVSERDIKNEYPNSSFTSPFVPPEEYQNVFSVPMPTFDSYTQICTEELPEITNKGHYEQVYKITDLTGDELQEGINRKTTDNNIKIERENKERISSLWQAAHDYEYKDISGSAIGLLTMGVMQSKPKCIAVQNWIKSIWIEYYIRKDGTSNDLDFSSVGPCPYTVPELMEELQ